MYSPSVYHYQHIQFIASIMWAYYATHHRNGNEWVEYAIAIYYLDIYVSLFPCHGPNSLPLLILISMGILATMRKQKSLIRYYTGCHLLLFFTMIFIYKLTYCLYSQYPVRNRYLYIIIYIYIFIYIHI